MKGGGSKDKPGLGFAVCTVPLPHGREAHRTHHSTATHACYNPPSLLTHSRFTGYIPPNPNTWCRHGKNFQEISKMCSRPMRDIVAHYFLHKHHLKAKTTGPRTPRGTAAKGTLELPLTDFTCRNCDGVCDASSAAVCTRKNCRSLTCVTCLEASGDQTLDKALSNPAWRCGRCRRMYGGSEGGSADRGRGNARAQLQEQTQIWNRIKKEQQRKSRGKEGKDAEGKDARGSRGPNGGNGDKGGKSSKRSKGGKGKKKARARAGSTDDDSDSSTGGGSKRGKGKRRRQAESPNAYLAGEEQGVSGAGKWQGHILFGAMGGMQQGRHSADQDADLEPSSSLEPHFQVHAQFNDSAGPRGGPGGGSSPHSARRHRGGGGSRGGAGGGAGGGVEGMSYDKFEAVNGGPYAAKGFNGEGRGYGGNDYSYDDDDDDDDDDALDNENDDEEEEWDDIFAGLPAELQDFLRKVYFTEQFAQFYEVLQSMDTSPNPLQEVRKCQSILAQAYNNELLSDFNALFNQ